MGGNQQATYNVSGVIDRLGGDREFLAECVDLFAAELPAMMETLRDSVRAAAADRVQSAAHALKGMTSNFCVDGPAETAGRIEQLARDGQLQETPRLVAQFEDEVARLQADLQVLTHHSPRGL